MNKQRHIKRRRYKTLIPLILLFGMAGICLCAAVYFKNYNKEAYERQEKEESIADDFINDLLEMIDDIPNETEAVSIDHKTEGYEMTSHVCGACRREGSTCGRNPYDVGGSRSETEGAQAQPQTSETKGKIYREEIDDPIYYERNGITYTPDYAVGTIQCVLEYPACQIKRGIYTGTWEEIAYDLDIWMATASRPDYVLGQTHMCIYGHNHTAQNLSFNNLKSAAYGDEFVLYAKSGVYFYEVTNIFYSSRAAAASNYVHNFNIDKSKCYIITCGRDNFLIDGKSTRYGDFIVEGTLKKYMTLREYKEIYAN